jgi:putative sigma-54 modulation protein
MQFKISGRHLEITPAIREYAAKKAERLPRHYDRVGEVAMVVDRFDHSFSVEIIAQVEHHEPVIVKRVDEDMYAAIDGAIDRIERQLTDVKEKLRNRKHIVG